MSMRAFCLGVLFMLIQACCSSHAFTFLSQQLLPAVHVTVHSHHSAAAASQGKSSSSSYDDTSTAAGRRLGPLALMTPEETDQLMTAAQDCAEGECSVDEVGDLIDILKVQQKDLSQRVQEIRTMIASLEDVNRQDVRKVDEVRETVRAIYRIFQLGDKASGNDYPKLTRPTGWTGDVGKGPKTAYDALPPKRIVKK